MRKEKGSIRRFTLFVLIVGALLLAYACIAVNLESDVLEYMFAADEVRRETDAEGNSAFV